MLLGKIIEIQAAPSATRKSNARPAAGLPDMPDVPSDPPQPVPITRSEGANGVRETLSISKSALFIQSWPNFIVDLVPPAF